MATVIEGGVIPLAPNVWMYIYTTNEGSQSKTFTSTVKPKIGDIINDDGTLTQAVLPKINNDTSKWQKNDPDTWGRDGSISDPPWGRD